MLAFVLVCCCVPLCGIIKRYTSLLVYADDIGRKCTYYKGKHRGFISASKEVGLEVNADKTKYMVMTGDQNAGRSHNIKTGNSSFERMGKFRYWEKTLAN